MQDTPQRIGELFFKETSVEWIIANFLERKYGTRDKWFQPILLRSPRFPLANGQLYIEFELMYNSESQIDHRMMFVHNLFMLDFNSYTPHTHVECTIKLKKSDGSVFESHHFNHFFTSLGLSFMSSECFKDENLLAWNGPLIVLCEARVVDDDSAEVARTSIPNKLETLSRHFENIYLNGCDRDVVIEVKGKKFSAHRLFLSARSSVFRSMFELHIKEKETGSVNITDCDPESFGAFLHFLYSGKSDLVTSDNAWDLYATAEKYNVQDLKDACSECMDRYLCVESVCDVVRLADLHGDQELLARATIYFIRNASEILKTSKWQSFARENFTLADKLFIEQTEESKRKIKFYDGYLII